jgi:hypothetical protein
MSKHAPETIRGKWRLTSMPVWSQDALDLVEPAYFRLGDGDRDGEFALIAVHGWGIGRIGPQSTSGKGRYAKFLLAAELLHPPMLAFPGRSGAVQKYVLSRMPSRDLVQSRAMWGLRHPREVVRYDPGMAADGPTAYDCTRTASPLLTTSVTTGGNSFVEEAAIGSSGLIASTNSLCDYADHFDIDGNYTTSPAGGYSFYGEFTGTNCGLVWQSGVTRYAWIFNSVNGDQGTLQGLLDNVCRGYDASGWP